MEVLVNVIDSEKISARIRRLGEIAGQLRGGQHFEITRLTMLKALFADPSVTMAFGLHLTKLARVRARKKFRPPIDRAVRLIQSHLRRPGPAPPEALWDTLHDLQNLQTKSGITAGPMSASFTQRRRSWQSTLFNVCCGRGIRSTGGTGWQRSTRNATTLVMARGLSQWALPGQRLTPD